MYLFTLLIIIIGILLLLIIASGFWLRKMGSPYKTGTVTLHKLVSVAFVAISAMLLKRWFNIETKHYGDIWIVVFLSLAVLFALISGGILSYRNEKNFLLILGHRLSTAIIIITIGILIHNVFNFFKSQVT